MNPKAGLPAWEGAAFRDAPVAMLVVDADRSVVLANEAAAGLSGFTARELRGRSITDLVTEGLDPSSWSGLLDEPGDSEEEPRVASVEACPVRVRSRSGREVSAVAELRALKAVADRTAVLVALQVSEENERGATDRRDQEALHQSALDAVPLCVYRVDLDGRLVFVNEATLSDVGVPREELLGKTASDLYPPEHAAKYREDDLRVAETREPCSYIEENVSPVTGDQRLVEVLKTPVMDSRGAVVGIQGIFRDVTSRVERESELRLHSEILARMSEGVLLVRKADQVILYANPQLLAMFGFVSDALIGQHVSLLDAPDGASTKVKMQEILEALEPYASWNGELLARRGDGEVFWCEAKISHVDHPEHGHSWICVCGDINDRKTAEIEREELRAHLAEARKMEAVGRFAGGIAHDYNNTLAVVMGSAEMALLARADEARVRERLEAILDVGSRSANLTRQLMAFARREDGMPRVFDLDDYIGEILPEMRQLVGDDVELHWTPGGVGTVYMDPSQMHQVLTNLCINARDAMRANPGTVWIETRTEPSAFVAPDLDVGDRVTLSVRDTGEGIAAGILDKVFDPFFTTKSVGDGVGLGLAMVYGIVQRNGGTIDVASTPGEGATFVVNLPRTDAGISGGSGPRASAPPLGGHESILLVEDEVTLLHLTRDVLEGLGYMVFPAEGPDEALEVARQQGASIDLVLTDVVMPGQSGRELVEQLDELCPRARVLFVSGYPADVVSSHRVLPETAHLLPKPWTVARLATKIRSVLDSHD